MIEPRLLNATQYGYLCPIHSPDGGNVGLHKHISTSSIITNGVSAKPFISYLKSLGVKLLEECSYDIISESTKIFINGAWIGITTNPIELTKTLRLHRRNNVIYEHTSVLFDIKRNEIQLWVDSGRISRPLFYIENKQPSYMKENIMKKIQDKSITWNELTKGTNPALNSRENVVIEDITKINTDTLSSTAGIIDYVDASEAESMLLMKTTTEVEEIKYETHAEIHESLILGFMANQIIFPENNPYPKMLSHADNRNRVFLFIT